MTVTVTMVCAVGQPGRWLSWEWKPEDTGEGSGWSCGWDLGVAGDFLAKFAVPHGGQL